MCLNRQTLKVIAGGSATAPSHEPPTVSAVSHDDNSMTFLVDRDALEIPSDSEMLHMSSAVIAATSGKGDDTAEAIVHQGKEGREGEEDEDDSHAQARRQREMTDKFLSGKSFND